MRQTILIAFLILGASLSASAGDNVYEMIKKGHLVRAADSLSKTSTAALRDGNSLFYLSLIESDGDKAANLMEAALRAKVWPIYREEINFRLAQYWFLKGNYRKLVDVVVNYRSMYEDGFFRSEMQRYSLLVDELEGNYESAVRKTDRFLLEHTRGDLYQLGTIDKARVMAGFGKRVAGDRLLKELTRKRKGAGVPLALYQLGYEAISKKRTDDAVFYYNLLREAYPVSVGLDVLIDRMSNMSAPGSRDNTAERLTGTFYSIQVGVFSNSGNARRQADKFRRYDQKVEIVSRKISGKTYKVVFVGRFDSYDGAEQFKSRLEQQHRDNFQVKAR
jgi:tetratricopeptide (TPR) repeat protein